MNPANSHDLLHADLGFNPLSSVWAKTEILLGLAAAVAGAVGVVRLAAYDVMKPRMPVEHMYCVYGVLAVLGGTLALAGQRSHLYQSNNKLAAHLASLIRAHPSRTPI